MKQFDIYSLEIVNSRIEFYEKTIENLKKKWFPEIQDTIDLNERLKSFWIGYKKKYYEKNNV